MSTTTHPELTPTQRAFRAAMSNLSAAVNIVTTDGPRGPAGITESATCSVTDSPPTMLVCVNRSSYTHDFFVENKRVGINVLGAEHEPIAMRFAGASDVSMGDRLSEPEWEHDSHGVPVLRDAEGNFHSAGFLNVKEVDKNTLGCFRPEINFTGFLT